MNKMLLSAGVAVTVIMISAAANAETATDTSRDRQMEAYRAYVQSQGTGAIEAGQADIAAGKPAANVNTTTAIVPVVAPTTDGVTTTVEKTTKTDYDVRKRKVGLVGGRAFPAKETKVEGGETKEVTVNGVPTVKEVIKADPMERKTPEGPEGDYYSGKRGVEAYKVEETKPNSNLDVHFTGKFNN